MKAFMCDECGGFYTFEFDTWAKIVDQAVTDSVHGKSNWYLEKAEEFTAVVERAGYQKSVRGIMPGPFGW